MLWICLALLAAGSATAQTVVEVIATRDNTLYEDADGNLSNGSGNYLFVGRTVETLLRRALIAFGDLSAVPAGAQLQTVELLVTMDRTVTPAVEVAVHPVIGSWGEGGSMAGGMEGGGGAAAADDATWLHRRFPENLWEQAGGDFHAAVTAASIDGPGDYVFPSSPALVQLVQQWLDDPAANDGIALIADESGTASTAKRFSSREGVAPPRLRITYVGNSTGPDRQFAGLWFDPALDGEGYNVIQAEVGTTIFFFGYGADMQRLWLVTDTRDVAFRFGEPVEFTVFVGMPGTFSQPTPSAQLQQWGTLTVTLTSCTEATFVLNGADGNKTSNAVKLVGVSGNECSGD